MYRIVVWFLLVGVCGVCAQSMNAVPDTLGIVDEGESKALEKKGTIAVPVGTVEAATVPDEQETIGDDGRIADSIAEAKKEAEDNAENHQREALVQIVPGNGIGFNIGLRALGGTALSALINATTDTMIADIQQRFGYALTVDSLQRVDILVGVVLRVKGVIHPIDYLCIEPAVTYMSTGAEFKGTVSNQYYTYQDSSYIGLSDLSFDVNVWAKPFAHKRVGFKAGLGVSYGVLALTTSGTMGTLTMEGAGAGLNILAGLDVTFPRVSINVDFVVPFARRELTVSSGSLAGRYSGIRLPSTFRTSGLEIRPGLTIHFGRAERVLKSAEK